jgi:MYND finger
MAASALAAVCAACSAAPKKLLVCGRCRRARYCNGDCQRTHWTVHSLECKSARAESTAHASPDGAAPTITAGVPTAPEEEPEDATTPSAEFRAKWNAGRAKLFDAVYARGRKFRWHPDTRAVEHCEDRFIIDDTLLGRVHAARRQLIRKQYGRDDATDLDLESELVKPDDREYKTGSESVAV